MVVTQPRDSAREAARRISHKSADRLMTPCLFQEASVVKTRRLHGRVRSSGTKTARATSSSWRTPSQ
eukprot:5198134-Lingulodinium_polyedra.AAC.1